MRGDSVDPSFRHGLVEGSQGADGSPCEMAAVCFVGSVR